jgi:DNA-binding transcriptional regulator YiaG
MNPTANLRAAVRFATRAAAPSTERVPGITLTLYREAAGVSAVDVARVLDATKQYVAKLERHGATIETAGRFRAAVDMLVVQP